MFSLRSQVSQPPTYPMHDVHETLNFQTTLNVGIGTVGVTSILFGLLDKIQNGKIFLACSFALRFERICLEVNGIEIHLPFLTLVISNV